MEWIRGHTIGHGSSATVSAAGSRTSGKILAVKSAEVSRSGPLQREHEILSTLSHPNIIGYIGCHFSLENRQPVFNLVMEYAAGGTLADAARRGSLDEPAIGRLARGIVKGLEYLHSRGIVHCDIKGSNILLSRDEAKIADLGCAKAGAAEVAEIRGTPLYMSPEAARGEEQSFPADVWSLGCTIIELATGRPPWPSNTGTLGRIAFSGETPEVPGFLSGSARDFVGRCLRVDPSERWTARQLAGHPFVGGLGFGPENEVSLKTCSPTSVLDGGIWRLAEVGPSEDVFEVGFGEYSNGPMQRIRECGDYSNGPKQRIRECGDFLNGPKQRIRELSGNFGRENWEREEGWMSVRDGER